MHQHTEPNVDTIIKRNFFMIFSFSRRKKELHAYKKMVNSIFAEDEFLRLHFGRKSIRIENNRFCLKQLSLIN
jgi:hypothetical protein